MSFTPFAVVMLLLVVMVAVLYVWRRSVASNEDDNLHVLDGEAAHKTELQVAMAQKLELIDKWGKLVTVVAVSYGLILGALYLYQSWIQNSRVGV